MAGCSFAPPARTNSSCSPRATTVSSCVSSMRKALFCATRMERWIACCGTRAESTATARAFPESLRSVPLRRWHLDLGRQDDRRSDHEQAQSGKSLQHDDKTALLVQPCNETDRG